MRKSGIIITLIGIGLFFISIFLSEGYSPRRNIISNMYSMEIVICPGRVVDEGPYPAGEKLSDEESKREALAFLETKARTVGELLEERKRKPNKPLIELPPLPVTKIVGRWAIPLNLQLSLSTIITLVGVGIILLTKKQK